MKKEIDAVLASRKIGEQKIMKLISSGDYSLYADYFSEFLSVLYGNPVGICVMTACLLLYVHFQWGVRLTQIDV